MIRWTFAIFSLLSLLLAIMSAIIWRHGYSATPNYNLYSTGGVRSIGFIAHNALIRFDYATQPLDPSKKLFDGAWDDKSKGLPQNHVSTGVAREVGTFGKFRSSRGFFHGGSHEV